MHDVQVPALWFRLPPGFHDIGPRDRPVLEVVAEALGGTESRRQIAQLMDRMDALVAHQVVRTSIGLHPEGDGGVSTSLFSLTIRQADHPNPRVTVARTALAIARSSLWSSATRKVIELASSSPCCLVAGLITPDEVDGCLFQARVVTADPAGRHIIILDLTSTAIEHAEAYTSILEAVTHTVSFSNPEARAPSSAGTSRILEVLL
ncbi:hypothetical protein ACFWUZ_01110 [Streptomyces sp. NPDC058646]|uniref:hypothetical protein n=1 Tax=Streptomyces sp. NPDC058646 TaxID=3346574 RepID=UPI0036602226